MKTAVIYDKWLSGLGGGEVVACNMATTLRDHGYDVVLVSINKVSLEDIKNKLLIDLKGIKFTNQLPDANDKQPDLFINISFMDYTYGFAKKNIYYVHFPSKIRSGLFNYVLHFFNKTHLQSLLPALLKEKINDRLRAGVFLDMKKRLDSYDIFITHSQFVADWTEKLWGKSAQILYPPVSLLTTDDQQLTTKRNWICSVGRFFTLGHGKKQEIMIDAFKELITNNQQLIKNKWQLHLVGGVGSEPSSVRFVKDLKQMAKGYPIFFHFNIDRKDVEDVLFKSKIYWHCAGYGENKEKDPIKFEHFGIAPVEAVSAGCIPVLYNGGGLSEIITLLKLSKDDYLFNSLEDLISKTTMHIMKKADLRLATTLDMFSKHTFVKNFLNIIS